MSRLPRFLALLCCAVAFGAQAQTAAPRVAITSLVGDALTLSSYRERTGTSIHGNLTTTLPVAEPVFDHAVLKAIDRLLPQALPGAQVALLRVPAAGSAGDPSKVLADDQLVAGNPLVEALRQQGYAYLVTATKLRASNRVKVSDGGSGEMSVASGQLHGLGFYVDPRIETRRVGTRELTQGLVAPHVYIQLTLVDLNAMTVKSVQKITATATLTSTRNASGEALWDVLSAEDKAEALERLIHRHVAEALPLLFR